VAEHARGDDDTRDEICVRGFFALLHRDDFFIFNFQRFSENK
jgi:hypothetical protein